MNLRFTIIFLILFSSIKLFAQPGPVDPCWINNFICLRLFDHGKLISKDNKQYSVHTAKPEHELEWQDCYWQTDSIYCFDIQLYLFEPKAPYIFFIIKGKDTMQIVIKNIFFNRFYIDSVSFMPGIYEIELPIEPYSLSHKSMPELYKRGIHEGFIVTPFSWEAIRVDDKKKGVRENKKQ